MDLLADLGKWASIIQVAGIFAIFALGLVVQVGHAGLDNFGQVGFMLLGAYGSTLATEKYGLGLLAGVAVGVGLAVLAALVVSLPTIRLRGDFLAIVTIAGGEILRNVALNERDLTAGAQGLNSLTFRVEVIRPIFRWARENDIEIDRAVPLIVITWALVLIIATLTWLLLRTPWGRLLRAVREDEDAARALGKNSFLLKAQALAIGAAWAAIAGVLFAWYQIHFSPTAFEPIQTFLGFIIIIVAGVGSIWGTVIVAVLLQALLDGSRYVETPFTNAQEAALRYMAVGLILMLMVYFRPQGIFGKREELALGE